MVALQPPKILTLFRDMSKKSDINIFGITYGNLIYNGHVVVHLNAYSIYDEVF